MLTPETIDRLKAQLLTSGLSQQNSALFQVINLLIDATRQALFQAQAITGSGSSGGGGLLTSTFLTENNETGTLPNSRQVLAGGGIQFNDTPGKRVISTNVPLGFDSYAEPGEMGPQGPQGIQGPIGLQGPPGIDGEAAYFEPVYIVGTTVITGAP